MWRKFGESKEAAQYRTEHLLLKQMKDVEPMAVQVKDRGAMTWTLGLSHLLEILSLKSINWWTIKNIPSMTRDSLRYVVHFYVYI